MKRTACLVEHPMHFRPGDDVAHDIMKFYKQTDKDGEEFAGCKRYSDGPLNDFRLCPTAEGKALVRCMRAGTVPFPSCTVGEYMGNETSVTYSYPLAYSDQAIAIDKKLMSLFDKWFWVAGRQGCEKQGSRFVCR